MVVGLHCTCLLWLLPLKQRRTSNEDQCAHNEETPHLSNAPAFTSVKNALRQGNDVNQERIALASALAVELLHGVADVARHGPSCDRGVLKHDAEVVIGTCARDQAQTCKLQVATCRLEEIRQTCAVQHRCHIHIAGCDTEGHLIFKVYWLHHDSLQQLGTGCEQECILWRGRGSPMKMKYSGVALSVLLVFRKCMSSCCGSVGESTVVGTVRPPKPTGSGGTSAGRTPIHETMVSHRAKTSMHCTCPAIWYRHQYWVRKRLLETRQQSSPTKESGKGRTLA